MVAIKENGKRRRKHEIWPAIGQTTVPNDQDLFQVKCQVKTLHNSRLNIMQRQKYRQSGKNSVLIDNNQQKIFDVVWVLEKTKTTCPSFNSKLCFYQFSYFYLHFHSTNPCSKTTSFKHRKMTLVSPPSCQRAVEVTSSNISTSKLLQVANELVVYRLKL